MVEDVSFRATMSRLFSFGYNSGSLCFGLVPWRFRGMMFVPMGAVIGCLSWGMAWDDEPAVPF